MTKKPKHDELFKRIMGNEIAAQEFLEYYGPVLRTSSFAATYSS
ncbi:hypothetical protein [Rickettsia endosymbiont of Oedothorax gibbosus]|nr:hypothetical protein [Rickettsia endosymbiont of Oedothorax gibbosus]